MKPKFCELFAEFSDYMNEPLEMKHCPPDEVIEHVISLSTQLLESSNHIESVLRMLVERQETWCNSIIMHMIVTDQLPVMWQAESNGDTLMHMSSGICTPSNEGDLWCQLWQVINDHSTCLLRQNWNGRHVLFNFLDNPKWFDMIVEKCIHSLSVFDLEGNSVLHEAVRTNQMQCFHKMLAYGVDPNLPNKNGDFPIHLALKFGSSETLSCFVESVFNSSYFKALPHDRELNTCLHVAVETQQLFHIKMMVELQPSALIVKNRKSQSVLDIALCSSEAYTPIISYLCQAMYDMYFQYLHAYIMADIRVTNFWLLQGAKSRQITMIIEALSAGADINAVDEDNHNALYYAATGNDLNIVKCLLSHQAKVTHFDLSAVPRINQIMEQEFMNQEFELTNQEEMRKKYEKAKEDASTFVFRSIRCSEDMKNSEVLSCSICLCDETDTNDTNDTIVTLCPCRHTFHNSCIRQHFSTGGIWCPECKVPTEGKYTK